MIMDSKNLIKRHNQCLAALQAPIIKNDTDYYSINASLASFIVEKECGVYLYIVTISTRGKTNWCFYSLKDMRIQ